MEIFGRKPAPGKAHIDLGKSRVDYEIEKLDSGYRVTGRIRGNPGRVEVVRLPAPDSFLMNNWQSWGPLQKVSPATRFPEYAGIRAKRRGYLFSPLPDDFSRTLVSDYFAAWDGALLGFLTSCDAHPFFAVEGGDLVGYLEYFDADLGDGIALEPLLILEGGSVEDLLEIYAESAGAANAVAVASWNPIGWCSWYQYFGKLVWEDILRNLDIAKGNPAYPFEVFQIDDGFEADIGDWDRGMPGYPSLAGMAEAVRARGFKAGIWTAPFSAAGTSELFRRHPEWMISENGLPKVAYTAWNKEIFGLDTTHPGAKEWLFDVFTGLKKAGFEYFKIDFLFAAAIPGDRARPVGPIRAYREGLEIIRKAVGRDFVLGCGAPLLPSAGLVDGMRIGEDTAPYWKTEPSPFLGPNAYYALKNALLRQFMHRKLWINDPDCVQVRASEIELSGNERELYALASGALDNMIVMSDGLDLVGSEGKDLFRRTLGLRGGRARVEGMLRDDLYVIKSSGGPSGDIRLAVNLSDALQTLEGAVVPGRSALRLR